METHNTREVEEAINPLHISLEAKLECDNIHHHQLQKAREEERRKLNAEWVVDLYEIRACLQKPVSLRQLQDPHEVFQWNWLNSLIAQLSDKHDVKHQEIEDVLRARSMARALTPNYPPNT